MITIRPFKASDTAEIIQLFKQTVHTIGAKYYTPQQVAVWAPVNQSPEELSVEREKWQQKLENHITFVAIAHDKLIGFADISRDGYLDHMYVHKDYQGCGASAALNRAIEQAARDLGLTKITTHASVMAMPIAKRIGYTMVKQQTVERNGVQLINYLMEKELRAYP